MKNLLLPRVSFQMAVAIVAVLAIAVIVPHTHLAALSGLGLIPFAGMIYDAQCLLSSAQALTLGTTVTTNTYDTGAAGNDVSVGNGLALAFTVDVAAHTSNGDETYTFEAIQSAAANLGTPTILAQVAIARATLVAGFKFYLPLPPGLKTQRYLGGQYVLGGTGPTLTCSCTIQPVSMLQNDKTYAVAYKVSS